MRVSLKSSRSNCARCSTTRKGHRAGTRPRRSCTKPEGRTEMGRIVVSDNVSLDGVIQDPAGDEGFRVGGWVGRIMDRKELARVTLDEALGSEALVLGRRSYEWFAARWPSRSGELADRLNSLPKYVVSSTLEHGAGGRGEDQVPRRGRGHHAGHRPGGEPVRDL